MHLMISPLFFMRTFEPSTSEEEAGWSQEKECPLSPEHADFKHKQSFLMVGYLDVTKRYDARISTDLIDF